MIWLVIINPATEKIRLVQCFDYEAREYNFFPDENGDPIYFTEHQYALAWIQDNIKEEEEKATAEAPQEETEEETLESLLKKAATEPAMRPQFYKKLLDTKIILLILHAN